MFSSSLVNEENSLFDMVLLVGVRFTSNRLTRVNSLTHNKESS